MDTSQGNFVWFHARRLRKSDRWCTGVPNIEHHVHE